MQSYAFFTTRQNKSNKFVRFLLLLSSFFVPLQHTGKWSSAYQKCHDISIVRVVSARYQYQHRPLLILAAGAAHISSGRCESVWYGVSSSFIGAKHQFGQGKTPPRAGQAASQGGTNGVAWNGKRTAWTGRDRTSGRPDKEKRGFSLYFARFALPLHP